ncbi:MAG: adenylyltransferase/cytidyltransferase family protein [Lentisphaeria bacterium]|nr:adenylyltransferase/cytidyltransferase family protein [Lentisphaeria bacterium]
MPKKIFVSGCYDMLHSGHVAFFEEAASHGELYVGLGSDKTIWELKGRKTINNDAERLYMVKAIRYVKDAWINSGSGIMDFEKEVIALKPDIFFVNTDGYSTEKEKFCKKYGIELIVSERVPSQGLPSRSTTALRQECRIPYRVELCGGWLDQPCVNNLAAGPVITISILPDYDFNERSGMATSSRKKAIELWQTSLPVGDPEKLAKQIFCIENPPGTARVSGAQDQLGIMMPALNKLNFDNGYWPVSIDKVFDEEILAFVENNLWLLQLPERRSDYDVYAGTNINAADAKLLAEATEEAWNAIIRKDIKAWGANTTKCFEAQIRMFPNMASKDVLNEIERYKSQVYGWKLTGAGGGGYLLLISDKTIPNAIKIHIRRD